jgi:hypothetical protein
MRMEKKHAYVALLFLSFSAMYWEQCLDMRMKEETFITYPWKYSSQRQDAYRG